ncbi:ABC transporter permease subunit [Paenibacillus sinopodophylli]|uniref:ABC transporter permease subunit n=1 Tax=Paenibacillus sinopodophylli TaxID=1837342 RepID=UPI00110C9DBA|nr:ABC transporter permease subunit [Paenibacillus sinopodophylli]
MEQVPTPYINGDSKARTYEESMLQRIWKYKFHYAIVIPALLLIAIFKFLPFVYGIFMSLVDFKPYYTLFENQWVGLDHYRRLFENLDYRSALMNTIIIKSSYILVCGTLSFLIALALSGVRSKLLRGFFSTLFLLPYFIPSVVFVYIVIHMLSPTTSPFFNMEQYILAEAGSIRLVIVLTETIKTCGIPVLIALAAIASKQSNATVLPNSASQSYIQLSVIPALRAVSAFMLLQLSTFLTTDYELLSSLLNPLTSSKGATLDFYQFQMGIMNGDASGAAAAGIIQFLVQLLLTLFAYRIIRGRFINDLFHTALQKPELVASHQGRNVAGLVIAAVYGGIIILVAYMLFVFPFIGLTGAEQSLTDAISFWNVTIYLILIMVAVFVFLMITVTLAYPLTVKKLPGRGAYKVFLLVAIVSGGGMVNELLFINKLGMIDTLFPQLFLGFFSLTAIFVIKSLFNARYSELKEKAEASGKGELHTFITLFIPKVWKPLLALGALHFVALWNSYSISYMYIANPENQSPMMQFMQLAFSMEAEGGVHLLQLGAWLSLPSIILFLLFRRWLNAEVFTSQLRK